ncbi:hypothetical protein SAY86_010369 [Trapa natans]|uniref:Inhibitor of growth protein N-terminal histone-binding domain-containing protein n=1 Tax=Trapa natans TaxID=22666 RepID=A0AAN7LHP2_TRANT|nr:hypothetical protein SAY86_010369 [Trapa natans]
MAVARTGVYIDDYFEDASTLPAELQRLLNTIRELDERSQTMINQTQEQTKSYLGLSMQSSMKGNKSAYGNRHGYEDEESTIEKIRKDIEVNQDNALNLCTEKVLLARQAFDLIDSHIKRLDEDLNNFAEDLKQEGKLPPDEPAILPPLPLITKNDKRKFPTGTPQSSKRFDHRDWERDRDRERDSELMPPPGSQKREFATPLEVDHPIDPDEPTYCVCHQVSFGDMIACDNENVSSFSFYCAKEVNGSITLVLG